MLKNYLLVAIRIMRRKPFFSAINIIGLGLAMGASLTILQYVYYHYDYNRSVPNAENIYRLGMRSMDDQVDRYITGIHSGTTIADRLAYDFPQVEALTQFQTEVFYHKNGGQATDHVWLSTAESDKKLKVEDFIFSDSSFFHVFQYAFEAKLSTNPFSNSNSAVISRALANRLFGSDAALGKTVKINDLLTVMITGIYNPDPATSVNYDMVVLGDKNRFWTRQVFVKLQPGTDISEFRYMANQKSEEYFQSTYEQFERVILVESLFEPLSDIHFSELEMEVLRSNTYPKKVFAFLLIIGFLIMGIAWANTLNMTLSQLINRSKEINLRKIVGASKYGLISQGMFEFLVISVLSLLVGLSISQLAHAKLSSSGLEFNPNALMQNPWFWIIVMMSILIVALLSAIVQSWFLNIDGLSAMSSAQLLKNAKQGNSMQRVLITFQFVCSCGLLVGITIINSQINFMLGKDLGYNPKDIIHIPAPFHDLDNQQQIHKRFIADAQLINGVEVAGSYTVPGGGHLQRNGMMYRPGELEAKDAASNGLVTPNFLKLYEVDLIAGRDFYSGSSTDQLAALLSDAKAVDLGFDPPESAVNASFYWHHWSMKDTSRHIRLRVIGVYEDYRMEAFNEPKAATGSFLMLGDELGDWPIYRFFSAKMKNGATEGQIAQLQKLYEKHFPNSVFEYTFFSDQIMEKYTSENLIHMVITILTGLAVVISCLGLIALISISLAQRTKEIGIRKVLGASFMDIFGGVSKGYLSIVIVASAIGLPLVWYFANGWLDGFTERISIEWSMMLLPVAVLIGLIMIILVIQIFRAANANPVESLRNE